MKLNEIKDSFRIDMIGCGRYCPEKCLGCGACEEHIGKHESLDRSGIERNLNQIIEETNERVIENMNSIVTTYIDTESLWGEAIKILAELLYETTHGRSRMLIITHGVRSNIEKMIERLRELIELIKQDKIPYLVLTFDLARGNGKFPGNYESYRITLNLLKEVLDKVEVSIQGDNDPHSRVYIGKAMELFNRVRSDLCITNERLKINQRVYTSVGRAVNLCATTEACDVIPAPEFVKKNYPKDHKWRGWIPMEGGLKVQPNRPGRTYNDSVDMSLWKEIKTVVSV